MSLLAKVVAPCLSWTCVAPRWSHRFRSVIKAGIKVLRCRDGRTGSRTASGELRSQGSQALDRLVLKCSIRPHPEDQLVAEPLRMEVRLRRILI
jgi:hypothetical protein